MIKNPEKRVEELDRELCEIKAEQGRLNEESLRWAEKRDILHEEIRKLRLEVNGLKEKRDTLNEEVQQLKILREEVRQKYCEKIERLKDLRKKLGEAQAKKPLRSSVSLKKEIEDIDWKIQTSSLSLKEEEKMVGRVKNLEVHLEVYRQMEAARDEISKLESEWKALKEEIIAYNTKISDVAEQSQKYHQKLTEKLGNIHRLKADADEMHKKYVENREATKPFRLKYTEILDEIKSLQKALREKEMEEKAKQLDGLRKKLEKDAFDKLKRGEKLSFEEFKILAEQRKI